MNENAQTFPDMMHAWRVPRFGGVDTLHCEVAPVPQLDGSVFARHCGAYAIATASAATHDALRALGAVETIDYEKQRIEEATCDIDLVFDLVGGDVKDAFARLERGHAHGKLVVRRKRR